MSKTNLRNRLVDLSFRDYTVDGRFISTKTCVTSLELLGSDLTDLLSEDGTWGAKEFYVHLGMMTAGEEIKDVFRTNIMVRDSKTNKLIAWKHLL